MKICLFDHHDYKIPTEGAGGITGLFQILYEELRKYSNLEITVIVNNKTELTSDQNFLVIPLDFNEIENIRYGRTPIIKYFAGDIFYTNSSGRHVNFDFSGFRGKWVSTCHGCQEWVGGSDVQIFVSNNQLHQHLRDNLFENYCNNYYVVPGVVDTQKLYYEEGSHNRIVWMGRIDGAKAERLYDIAKHSNEKIVVAGWYSPEWEWLFKKIIETNNIEWVGKIEGDEAKRKFYSQAKVSIHCSTFEDPCPTTVIESQSCGVPVISYANGSLLEICYYQDLIFNDLENFMYKLNNFNKEFYSEKELLDFTKRKFDKKLYGENFYKIFNNLNH